MNTSMKVTKYQLYYSYKGVAVFYTVIVLIMLAVINISNRVSEEVTFGGLGTATVIFLAIVGLDCFKSSYKFMTANNVSRKKFYYGNMASLVIIAAFMALVDTLINGILSQIFRYESLLEQLYRTNNYLAEYFWSFGLYTLVACGGWLITMIYYRANRMVKILVSVIPVAMIILYVYIERQTGGMMSRAIVGFLGRAMGFAYNNNAYIGALSLFAGTALLLSACYLLVRKAPIND